MKLLLKDIILKRKILPEKDINKYIKAGMVLVDDVVNSFPNDKVDENSSIRIKKGKEWVSRGAYKLLHALEVFQIDVNGFTCIDIGASTGGFTEVLLSKGAKFVYCVDSGYNQIDYKLRIHEQTKIMESTNLKAIGDSFNDKIDIIVCDVSFISLKHVFNVARDILSPNKKIIVLIKPEFEASSNLVDKGGYVDIKHHQKIINSIIEYAETQGFKSIKTVKSPILGKKSKNIEYLSIFRYI